MKDTYNRVVMTVIAFALVALAFQGFTSNNSMDVIPAAHAASGHKAMFFPNTIDGFNRLQSKLNGSTPVMMDFGRFDNKDGVLVIFR